MTIQPCKVYDVTIWIAYFKTLFQLLYFSSYNYRGSYVSFNFMSEFQIQFVGSWREFLGFSWCRLHVVGAMGMLASLKCYIFRFGHFFLGVLFLLQQFFMIFFIIEILRSLHYIVPTKLFISFSAGTNILNI